jgi:hypothetical protein
MKRQFLLLLCSGSLLLTALPSHAEVAIAKVQAMLAKPKQMCGRFEQSKQLAGIKKPLQSSGRFCIVQGKGILWRTLQPFPNTLKLTRDEIVQTQGERVSMRIDAKQEPTVRTINSLLFSLLAGDMGQLQTLFKIDGSIDGKTWKVGLLPRDAGLAKAIGAIALEGGEYVKDVTISEANGDRTSIVFSEMQSGDAALTAEEAAQF